MMIFFINIRNIKLILKKQKDRNNSGELAPNLLMQQNQT